MTRPIAPLILSSPGGESQRPLVAAGGLTAFVAVHGVSTLDNCGRVADASVVRALGWMPGTRLHVREQGRLVVAGLEDQGVFQISRTGHLLIPVPIRRWCGLRPGDRVLLAGDPDRGLIIVHPPEAIDAMVEQLYAIRLGDPA